jgi:hypothetical protein
MELKEGFFSKSFSFGKITWYSKSGDLFVIVGFRVELFENKTEADFLNLCEASDEELKESLKLLCREPNRKRLRGFLDNESLNAKYIERCYQNRKHKGQES